MSKVFISYRREDSGHAAARVHDRLATEFGQRLVFLDVDSIPLGVNFSKAIRDEVGKCELMLAIIGPRWLTIMDAEGNRRIDNPADFVRIEIAAALARNIPVIPVFLDGVRIPIARELPREIRELALRQGIDVRAVSFHSDIERLVAGINSLKETPIDVAARTMAEQLEWCAGTIDRRLDILISPQLLPKAPQRLIDAMRYACFAGTKHLRPFLLAEFGQMFGLQRESTIDMGAALACMHISTLVHDDLPCLDDDDIRRGRPTVHIAFDEATAVLAGDALSILAFDLALRSETHRDPTIRTKLAMGLARCSGAMGVLGGQITDMQGIAASYDDILQMTLLKTGALIAFSCEAGAILANASTNDRMTARSVGKSLALIFQITDDLLDLAAVDAIQGDTINEARAKIPTLVSTLGRDGAIEKALELEAEAISALAPFGEGASVLVEFIRFLNRRDQ